MLPETNVGKLPFLLHAPAPLQMPNKVTVGGEQTCQTHAPFPNVQSVHLSHRLSRSLVVTGEGCNLTWGR